MSNFTHTRTHTRTQKYSHRDLQDRAGPFAQILHPFLFLRGNPLDLVRFLQLVFQLRQVVLGDPAVQEFHHHPEMKARELPRLKMPCPENSRPKKTANEKLQRARTLMPFGPLKPSPSCPFGPVGPGGPSIPGKPGSPVGPISPGYPSKPGGP